MQLNDASFSQLRILAFFIAVLMVSQSIANLVFKYLSYLFKLENNSQLEQENSNQPREARK